MLHDWDQWEVCKLYAKTSNPWTNQSQYLKDTIQGGKHEVNPWNNVIAQQNDWKRLDAAHSEKLLWSALTLPSVLRNQFTETSMTTALGHEPCRRLTERPQNVCLLRPQGHKNVYKMYAGFCPVPISPGASPYMAPLAHSPSFCSSSWFLPLQERQNGDKRRKQTDASTEALVHPTVASRLRSAWNLFMTKIQPLWCQKGIIH